MANEIEFDERIYDVLLKTFKKELNAGLEGYYVWKLNKNVWNDEKVKLDIRKEFKDEISNEKSIPKQTIILKQKLKENLGLDWNNKEDYLKFAQWVIHNWGGIPKPPEKKKLFDLRGKLMSGDSTNVINSVDNISSLSKVAAFYDDSKYAVYDFRVAFSLNWLIFIYGLHCKSGNGGKMKFFRQPSARGRNSDMNKKEHRQLPFFQKIFKEKYEKETENNKLFLKSFYYSEEETYQKYCELLKNTCEHYRKNKIKYTEIDEEDSDVPKVTIGTLEMCLFSIAAEDKRLSKKRLKCNYGIHNGDNDGYITDQMDQVLREPIVKAVKEERERLKSKYSINK